MNIKKAGAIVRKIENGEVKILLLHLIKHDYWSFPKGHCEEGESAEETAKRELLEETGLKIHPIKLLGNVNYKDVGDNDVQLLLFLGEIEAGELKNEEGHDLAWMTVEEAIGKLTYTNLQDFLKSHKTEIIKLK